MSDDIDGIFESALDGVWCWILPIPLGLFLYTRVHLVMSCTWYALIEHLRCLGNRTRTYMTWCLGAYRTLSHSISPWKSPSRLVFPGNPPIVEQINDHKEGERHHNGPNCQ